MCFTKTSKLPDPCELSPTITAHTVVMSHNKALEIFLPWLLQLHVQTIARATFAFMDDHQPRVTVSTWKELIRELYFILIYGQILHK